MQGRAGPSPLKLAIMFIACIVLGAITTLGIAWSCAAWVNAASAASVLTSRELTPREVEELVLPRRNALTTARFTGMNVVMPSDPSTPTNAWRTETTQRAFGHTRVNRLTSNMQFDIDSGSVMISGGSSNLLRLDSSPICETIDQAGWPFRAFECSMPMAQINSTNVSIMLSSGAPVVEDGITLPADASGRWRALPYRPRWLGLIGNVLLFAMLWFGVLLMPGMMRRRGRRKRGECIACGYDLRGVASERCPECWLPHGRRITTEGHGGARSGEESETPTGGEESGEVGEEEDAGSDDSTGFPPARE